MCQQDMHLFSTEGGENQQREQEGFGVERAMSCACCQLCVVEKWVSGFEFRILS